MVQPVLPTPEELRRLRIKAGLTQKELAKRAGVSQSLIARIEKGNVNPRLSTLKRILTVLQEATSCMEDAKSIMHSPVITLNEDEPLTKAVELMEKYGISQIPVLDKNNRVIGVVTESSILKRIATANYSSEAILQSKVKEALEPPLPMVAVNTKIDTIIPLLMEYPAVLVVDKGNIVGIITKIDLIRKKVR